MSPNFVLASGSPTRAAMLARAGLDFVVAPARIDERAVIASMQADGIAADQIADALADAKAAAGSRRHPAALSLGADQIALSGAVILQKPENPDEARRQLRGLSGRSHDLFSSAVLYSAGRPQWRHTGHVRMTMRDLSEAFIDAYVDRNWADIRHSVGCYQIEAEGIRLFSRIEGDYFHILGLPLLELVNYLHGRGLIET